MLKSKNQINKLKIRYCLLLLNTLHYNIILYYIIYITNNHLIEILFFS